MAAYNENNMYNPNDTIIFIHPSDEDATTRQFEINTNGRGFPSNTNLNANLYSQQTRPQRFHSLLDRMRFRIGNGMWSNENNILDDRINRIMRWRERVDDILTMPTSLETVRAWRPISQRLQSLAFGRQPFSTERIPNSEYADSPNSPVEAHQIATNNNNISPHSTNRTENPIYSRNSNSSNTIRINLNQSPPNGIPISQSFRQNQRNTASNGSGDRTESHQNVHSNTINGAGYAYEYLPEWIDYAIRYLPFVAIFLLKSLVDHWLCLLHILFLHFLTFEFDSTLSTYLSSPTRRRFFALCLDFFTVLKLISYCFIVFKQTPDYLGLIMYPLVGQRTFFGLLHAMVLNDIGLKLMTMSIKMSLTLFFAKLLKHKVMGRLFALIEGMSQMYRSIAPIRTWLQYIFPPSYTGWKVIAGILLSSFYISAKFYECVVRARLLKNKFCSFIRNADFDKPTAKQLQDNCNMCAICRETYTAPLILKCKHIFCEACITTWFEQKNNCPICRRKVKGSLTWHNGRTSLLYQIF